MHYRTDNPENIRRRWTRFVIWLSATVAVFGILAASCGSATQTDQSGSGDTAVDELAVVTIGDSPDLRAHTRPSSSFTPEDFINAGWKQNKEYDVATLPEATAALFGFFNRRDIELRFYTDRNAAMGAGREAAEVAIDTNKLSGRGAGFSAVTLYGAYLIAGNVVMLCEISVDDCTALIEAVDDSN